ncbi:MAG: Na/Pi cotransporter family protein [Mongoliibacter sp.]|uniref:Na/Pi cotransporter family protein n=1 Tax=Mongoliibacter sp. TaxID=2022438 RepID=UPI0012F140AE|nr:Na/Pi symporter [Mongoliibacter sp.]TVP49651.1 MAG: Na/Pi cotransporter family protein [Mongoliibacter sp.]
MVEEEIFDFWKFLAGIGIFLWGMHQLENAIKELGGKSFRNLLQKSTDTAFKGILIGAFITAILQSSSLVTLMVLAFLGAGVINLKNSIGVILGANLGTTITAWIVATLGFKLSVADFAMPFLGLGSLLYLFSSTRPVLKNIGAFAVGFGLLFLGLDFMKTSIESVADQVDLSAFHAYGLSVYLLIGIVVTALIQSSSAMIVIVLSALNAQVIGLMEGVSLIIGANIGTTVTVGIGALGGSADKKRLALAHFIFNVGTGMLIFIFIHPFVNLFSKVFDIADPLIELVLISTFIKTIGVIIFFPLIPRLEKWLVNRFKKSEPIGVSKYVKNVSSKIPEVGIAALEKDILFTFEKTEAFIINVWNNGSKQQRHLSIWRKILQQPTDLMEQYKQIKILEDELTNYHTDLQEENLSLEDSEKLTSLMITLRTLVYAAKDLKDVMHNIRDMEEHDDFFTESFYKEIKSYTALSLTKTRRFLENEAEIDIAPAWLEENAHQYDLWIKKIYLDVRSQSPEFPISTLTNVIKQVISCMDNLGSAAIHFKLNKRKVLDKE